MDLIDITIDQQYIDEILSIVGYPVLEMDDFELNIDDLKKLVIVPALREYYKWFPKTKLTQLTVSGTFEADFPEDAVYNALDMRFSSSNYQTDMRPTGNPLVDSRHYYSSNYRTYGTRYDYGLNNAVILDAVTSQSMVDFWKTVKFDVDRPNRKITGYTNTPGRVNITWALYDENFDGLPFTRMNEVIKLCQAFLLEKLVMIRGQITGGTPTEFNYGLFEDKAAELKDEVIPAWKAHTKVVITRH